MRIGETDTMEMDEVVDGQVYEVSIGTSRLAKRVDQSHRSRRRRVEANLPTCSASSS